MESIIRTRGLSKSYGDKPALTDFEFELKSGDICGLIGKNGAGKTTLMKIISGQVLPNSGTVELFGKVGEEARKNKRRIGFLIDNEFFENFNAEKNLEYFRIQRGIPDRSSIKRVLDIVELGDCTKKTFKQYSKGMKQRLGLALALLSDPDVLILDEPTNGLDPEGINDIRNLLLMLNKEKNVTIFISSHILTELQSISSRFIFVDKGRLIGDFTKEEFEVMSRGRILMRVDNASKAASAIENSFKGLEYVVLPYNEISVDGTVKANELLKRMIESGIEVYEMKNEHETLEQHFLETVGGEK